MGHGGQRRATLQVARLRIRVPTLSFIRMPTKPSVNAAYRNPGKYRDEICCDAASPEQLNTGLPSRRERQLQVLRILLPAAFTFAAILAAGWVATGGADWLWLAALASGGVLLGRCMEKWL